MHNEDSNRQGRGVLGLRELYDAYLPESIPAEDVEAELEVIQKRFREEASALSEGEAWFFPEHYQHVRVFYVYVFKPEAVCPLLAHSVQRAMSGFDDRWIGEIECYEEDGGLGSMSIFVYLRGEFILEDDELSRRFAAALQANSRPIHSPHALNPAIALWFQAEYHWRGIK